MVQAVVKGNFPVLTMPGSHYRMDVAGCSWETVEKDLKGLVRTVEVLMRPRDSREKSFPYKRMQMIKMKVPVQRLVLIEKSSRVQEILKADTEAVDEVTVSASCTSRKSFVKLNWEGPSQGTSSLFKL